MTTPPRKTASDFDPDVLRLFDEYVHGGIDRRGFLAGAVRSRNELPENDGLAISE